MNVEEACMFDKNIYDCESWNFAKCEK